MSVHGASYISLKNTEINNQSTIETGFYIKNIEELWIENLKM